MKNIILYTQAIKNLRPDVGFSIDGVDIATLKFNGNATPPTEEEVLNEYEKLKFEYESNEYARKRESEYPPMTDYLDAIYHQSKGDSSKMDSYLNKCEQVKIKYPKP
jgi:hypothetical protein